MSLEKDFKMIENDLIKISNHLYNNPELGDEEFESSKMLVEYLESHQFKVETGIVDRPTSFRAEFSGTSQVRLSLFWQSMMRFRELGMVVVII